ncbi:hypothetical protein L1887_14292 [Cichorium endivia]|nr:hypothetical protein L1887_14292 [Cichorium endivia]
MDPNLNASPHNPNQNTSQQYPSLDSPTGSFMNLLQQGSGIPKQNLFQQPFQQPFPYQQPFPFQPNAYPPQFQPQFQSSQQQQESQQASPELPDSVRETQPEIESMGRGAYRNTDSVSSKWRDLRASCTSFNDIFNNLSKMQKSGQSDFDVLNTTLQQYRQQHANRAFTHMKA